MDDKPAFEKKNTLGRGCLFYAKKAQYIKIKRYISYVFF